MNSIGNSIRPCRADERAAILTIVNAAAEVYRGVIPADRWHVPYMLAAELDEEIAAGVMFWGYEQDGALLKRLRQTSARQLLVGTWAAADWAIRFYQCHGFALVSSERKAALLKMYWTIPERQIETSVVLADPPLD
jgi:hypothetical protein